MAKRTCILVNSPDLVAAEAIRRLLPAARFELIASQPGLAFMQAARQHRPGIAVLDRVHERPEAARMEIAVLREGRPEVRIIALSEQPSPADGWVVEEGVFFYMTVPPGPELVRVIEAAARPPRRAAEPCP